MEPHLLLTHQRRGLFGTCAIASVFCSLALQTGCTALQFHPSAKPVIEDHIGKQHGDSGKADDDHRVGTLATVAQRRLVLVRYKDARFCAEPSPDAADHVSTALSAALDAEKSDLGKVSGALAATFASFAKQFSYRTQGLQLYRDGMFALCNAYMNGAISSEAEWAVHQGKLLETVSALIKAEIPLIPKVKLNQETMPAAPAALALTLLCQKGEAEACVAIGKADDNSPTNASEAAR